ncbi:MAG: rRNA maturation RNase YbeY [Lutibacter sp.]|jgi:rRNA maturation RNase YbeY|nr:rRNA maturation RNase YbeY [Lutibacter sp.]
MIQFHYETDFLLQEEALLQSAIERCVQARGFSVGALNYIFCDDPYLHNLNTTYLDHDTYTDIITFDYRTGEVLSADIFISVERVTENAIKFSQTTENELYRVVFHGVLHCMGYTDKTPEEQDIMRKEEEKCLALLTTI